MIHWFECNSGEPIELSDFAWCSELLIYDFLDLSTRHPKQGLKPYESATYNSGSDQRRGGAEQAASRGVGGGEAEEWSNLVEETAQQLVKKFNYDP